MRKHVRLLIFSLLILLLVTGCLRGGYAFSEREVEYIYEEAVTAVCGMDVSEDEWSIDAENYFAQYDSGSRVVLDGDTREGVYYCNGVSYRYSGSVKWIVDRGDLFGIAEQRAAETLELVKRCYDEELFSNIVSSTSSDVVAHVICELNDTGLELFQPEPQLYSSGEIKLFVKKENRKYSFLKISLYLRHRDAEAQWDTYSFGNDGAACLLDLPFM